MKFSDLHWQWLYGTGMGIVLCSLPFFNLGMSIGGFWLAGVWIVHAIYEGITRREAFYLPKKFFANPGALLLTGFFALHVLGMIHTEDVDMGLRDLRIKLPMLFMPVAFSAFPALKDNVREKLEALFTLAVGVAAIVLLIHWQGAKAYTPDVRDAHLFISHIRFGLMVALASFFCIRFLLSPGSIPRWFWGLNLLALLVYIWSLQSITAGIILVGVMLVTGARSMWYISRSRIKWSIGLGLLALLIVSGVYVYRISIPYFNTADPEYSNLPEKTENGFPYYHKYGDVQKENGHLVWYFVSTEELEPSWNERSQMHFWGNDKMGQPLLSTLCRYLSSKGLTKDKAGMEQLSGQDIRQIESGTINYLEPQWTGLEKRLNQVFFEINAFRSGGNPSGNSLLQRMEFWRAAEHILEDRWLIGVGTGDLQRAFDRAYEEIESPLDPVYRHRAHNQYLSAWLAMGLMGLLWILSMFIVPIVLKLGYTRSNRALAFFTVAALSFLSEDTLETQAGITFFCLFYCWYVVAVRINEQTSEKSNLDRCV